MSNRVIKTSTRTTHRLSWSGVMNNIYEGSVIHKVSGFNSTWHACRMSDMGDPPPFSGMSLIMRVIDAICIANKQSVQSLHSVCCLGPAQLSLSLRHGVRNITRPAENIVIPTKYVYTFVCVLTYWTQHFPASCEESISPLCRTTPDTQFTSDMLALCVYRILNEYSAFFIKPSGLTDWLAGCGPTKSQITYSMLNSGCSVSINRSHLPSIRNIQWISFTSHYHS